MKKALLSLAVASLLSANSTMCFKENWTKISQIETTALDGGKCESKYSVQQMKAKGWRVDDIKISSAKSGMSYMYVFKKGVTNNVSSTLNEDEIYERVERKIIAKQEKKKKEKKEKAIANRKANGKKLYMAKCQSCHGQNAEKEAYGTSKPLNTLTQEQFEVALRDFDSKERTSGNSFVMYSIANSVIDTDIEDIYSYIQTLK